MADTPDTASLAQTIERLRPFGVVPGITETLEPDAGHFVEALQRAIVADVAAFSESGNPEVLPALAAHLDAQVDEILRLLGGGRPGNFEFVAGYAEACAGQKFPLDALLHAYRCMHKALLPWVRDAALAAADRDAHVPRVVAAVTEFTIEYAGAISTLITSRYVQHTRLVAEAEGDRRTALLNTLLEGYDESDRQAAKLLRRAGYLEQRQSYCVVVARSVNPAEMENPARAQRMADAITQALEAKSIRVIAGVRDNLVVAVTSATRRVSGWTAPQSKLADRVYDALLPVGPAALIGLSNDVPSTSHVPRAADEARFALEFASVSKRVFPYARISFGQLVVAHARDQVQSALPEWLGRLSEADERSRGKLSATLEAYADADMNVLETAKRLGIHPNTVYARMQRIEEQTGLSPLSFRGLSEMLLALQCR